jgi:SAM-dependent methyltransferase
VRRCASRIVNAAGRTQILDVACGAGRNSFYLAGLGCKVVCLDLDLSRLWKARQSWSSEGGSPESLNLVPQQIDLLKDPWPFEACTVGSIVNVHFFSPRLFLFFKNSLLPGAYLLIETPPGCGYNCRDLPIAGAMKFSFEEDFDIEIYSESKVGPPEFGAVTVKMLAKRRNNK